MTDFAIHDRRSLAEKRVLSLERLRSYLRFRDDRKAALNDLERLDDRALRDVSIERHDIARRVDEEMTRLGLRELGSRGLR